MATEEIVYQRENADDYEAELKVILKKFPHRHTFGRDFKENVDNVQALCEQSLEHLEQSRDTDPDHFWVDKSRSNYLTMLYLNCDSPKLEEAKKQNEETLNSDPRNFNALWNRWELYRLEKNKQEEASETIKEMERILEDGVQMCTAKAELGVYYPDFGPTFYQKAVNLLEEALKETVDKKNIFPSGFMSSPACIKWKFDLARTYSKLLNKGTAETFWEGRAPSHEKFFQRIKTLLNDVIKSEDPFYSAKAWIELVDAYQKSATEGPSSESLPENMTVDDCYERALEKAPEDFFVLERSGRYYRQKGGRKHLERAIELLEKSTELNPLRDVAFHHLGLTYRAIWIIDEGHEEAKLSQPKPEGGRASHMHTDSVGRGRSAMGRGGGRGGRERGGRGNRGAASFGDGFTGLKKPGYFDTLKTNNPISKNSSNRDLLKAIECLEKACELTKKRHPRYLIDLARLLISRSQMDEARQLLKLAEDTQLNSTDGAYLYEQFGLLEESIAPQQAKHSDVDVFKNAKNCYRKSILHAVEGKEKSRVAIFRLRDILAKQTSADSVLEKEQHLINEAIQNATSSTDILARLTKEKSGAAHLKELMELFRLQDKEAAAVYAELLKSATDSK